MLIDIDATGAAVASSDGRVIEAVHTVKARSVLGRYQGAGPPRHQLGAGSMPQAHRAMATLESEHVTHRQWQQRLPCRGRPASRRVTVRGRRTAGVVRPAFRCGSPQRCSGRPQIRSPYTEPCCPPSFGRAGAGPCADRQCFGISAPLWRASANASRIRSVQDQSLIPNPEQVALTGVSTRAIYRGSGLGTGRYTRASWAGRPRSRSSRACSRRHRIAPAAWSCSGRRKRARRQRVRRP